MRIAPTWQKNFLYALAVALGFAPFIINPCFAASNKIDCDKILTQLETGKSAQQIAQEMGIQTSAVYGCEKDATRSIPSASASPGAMPSSSAPSH